MRIIAAFERAHGGGRRRLDGTRTRASVSIDLALLSALASILALFSLSAPLLWLNGYGWVGDSGPTWQKVHPSTYLGVATLVLISMRRLKMGRPFLPQDRTLTLYCGAIAVVEIYGTAILHLPSANLIDTFLLPAMMLVILAHFSFGQLRTLSRMLDAVFVANAGMGAFEFVTRTHLTPPVDLVFLGVQGDTDWRAQGLFGHPIIGSLLISMYVIVNLAPGARPLTPSRSVLVMLNLIALLFFGGRASSVLLGLFLAALFVTHASKAFRRGGVSAKALASILFASMLVLVAFYLSFRGLASSQFMDRFYSDNGSAVSRVVALEVINMSSAAELLFGDFHQALASKQEALGIEVGIEISWLSMMLHYGFLATLLLLAAYVGLLRRIARDAAPIGKWVVAFFAMSDLGSVGISAKNPALAMMVCVVYAYLPVRNAIDARVLREDKLRSPRSGAELAPAAAWGGVSQGTPGAQRLRTRFADRSGPSGAAS